MGDLRLVELSAATIVAVNNMSLKPGQEEYLSPVSYGIAATVVSPQTTWQRVVLDGEEVVGFVSGNFDPDDPVEHFRSVLWRINVDADDQGRGVDVDPPQHRPEMLFGSVLVEVGADEPDDLVRIQHDALPRRLRIDDRRGDAVADRREELLLAGLERHIVDRHDGRGGQFDESQITHAAQASPDGGIRHCGFHTETQCSPTEIS